MKQLHEQYRPSQWSEVVGQSKVIKRIEGLRARGLAGRAYWLSGSSGTGKTTIAKLIAAEVADELGTEEMDAGGVTVEMLQATERSWRCRCLGGKGHALIINEAHGIRKSAIRQLLVMLERLPSHSVVIFTTTTEGQEALFEDCDDASPLLSRCLRLDLARRDLNAAFAERVRMIAQEAGLDGQPIEKYKRLLNDNKQNMRAALMAVESGAMVE